MRKSTSLHEPTVSTGADSDTLSHWIKLAFITMRREMEAALRKTDMTVTQWRALGILFHKPGATHSDLVGKLEIEAPSVTSLVNGMERNGWVTQERSTSDARVKELSLTPRGRRMIEGAAEALSPIEQRMAASLSDAERVKLKQLLHTVINGLHEI